MNKKFIAGLAVCGFIAGALVFGVVALNTDAPIAAFGRVVEAPRLVLD